MPCEHATLRNGARAIVCSQAKRCKCGRRATMLCDWKVPERKSGTCDAPLCQRCATSPAPGKDLCVKHVAALEQWKAEKVAKSGDRREFAE
ncbi:MAG: hypothetical protein JWR77_2345 [Rhizorhabdus sp.]|nr:hypothetical protein [Rhizorhabdus sp.]